MAKFLATYVPLTRGVVVSHEVHNGSVVLDIHPTSASFNLSNKLAASKESKCGFGHDFGFGSGTAKSL